MLAQVAGPLALSISPSSAQHMFRRLTRASGHMGLELYELTHKYMNSAPAQICGARGNRHSSSSGCVPAVDQRCEALRLGRPLPVREVPAATPCAAAEENWSNSQREKGGRGHGGQTFS